MQLHREPVDVQDLLGSILHQANERLCNRPINVTLAPDLPMVPMDAVLIGQVINNLLDNACKYSSPSSPIGISITVNRREDWIEIAVIDHGIGVPADELDRVFDKFFRSKAQKTVPGTGLGLSICKGVVEVHGGTISARNNPDEGLTVQFNLPLHV